MQVSASTAVFALTASKDGVRDGLHQLRHFLDASGLSQDACGTAEIVLAEALNNIAEHAYDLSGTGKIVVTLQVEPDGTQIEIVDYGAALPGFTLPDGRLPSLDRSKDALPEGGFGWFLIRSQTDELNYHRRNGCNHLHMHIAHQEE